MTQQKKRWFAHGRYGYGWRPASVHGWMVTFGSMALLVLGETLFIKHMLIRPSLLLVCAFAGYAGLVIFVLFVICYRRGEEPCWRWRKDIRKK